MPTLSPPPLDTALSQQDGKAAPPWARWLQQLWDTSRSVFAGRVALAAPQSVSHATPTKISFDTVEFQSGDAGSFSGGTFTAGQPGPYLVCASLTFGVSGFTGVYQLTLYKGGAAHKRLSQFAGPNGGTLFSAITLGGATIVDLSAGDTLELYAYQEDSATAARSIGGDVSHTHFSVTRL